jgi:cAMP-dependent protein kinase regulator
MTDLRSRAEPRASTHSLSPLDQAHAHRLEGDEQAALRLAIACAEAAPDAPGPMALIARILVDQERVLPPDSARRLVDAFVRRGDLASAVVASTIALDAGEPQRPLLAELAAAFAKGSKLVGKGTVAPPPFPLVPPLSPELAALSDEPLFEAAERVLAAYVASKDAIVEARELPSLPLFGALAARELEQLLAAARVEEVSQGHEIVRQGDLGNEAFVLARGLLEVVRREGADETVLAQLGPGSIFGEMALLSESPRSASVIALEPAQLLVLARDELERAAEEDPGLSAQLSAFCHQRMHNNLVRHARMLSGLTPPQRVELLPQLESRLFAPGDVMIARDQEATSIFLIASGAVTISLPEGGDRLVLATLGPGEIVGEMSLILRRPASADVIALYQTVAYELARDNLVRLMRKYPALLVELYDLATRRDEEIRAATGDEALSAEDILV